MSELDPTGSWLSSPTAFHRRIETRWTGSRFQVRVFDVTVTGTNEPVASGYGETRAEAEASAMNRLQVVLLEAAEATERDDAEFLRAGGGR